MDSKLIVALDFDRQENAFALVNQLAPELCALKVGSEMFTLFGADFVRKLIQMGFRVFLDLKFHDIPNTVAQACKACAELGVWMLTIHASGGLVMMQAVKDILSIYGADAPLVVAITVLTSMSLSDLSELGIETSIEAQVQKLARLAHQAGLNGVVSSAFEVPVIKASCGESFLTVTPGIRLPDNEKNDQSRIMTPAEAIQIGSDYLVIGRPITRSQNPAKVVEQIISSIKS